MTKLVAEVSKFKIRVPSDKVAKARKIYGDMAEIIPTDMYGTRITHGKNNDIQTMIDDVNEGCGLD